MSEPRILKRSVVKEELVALTGHFMEALILNQFLYWTRRIREYDQMLQEELELIRRDCAEPCVQPKHGWIYKKAEELSDELMVGISASTIRRYISSLVGKGYISERNNPAHSWDKTKQYRVNFACLQKDLASLGYALDGFALPDNLIPVRSGDSNLHNTASKAQSPFSNSHNSLPIIQNPVSSSQIPLPNPQITAAISESTSEITPENTSDNTHYPLDFEAFWTAYPKQVNKWGAFREWQRALKRKQPQPVSSEELVAAAMNYAQAKCGVEPRYLKKPAIFLGQDCHYLDYAHVIERDRGGEVAAGQADDTETRSLIADQTSEELIATLNAAPSDLVSTALWYVRSELQARGLDVDCIGGRFELADLH